MVSPVLVSVVKGGVVIELPEPVPIGAVPTGAGTLPIPMGLLPEPDGIEYGAEADPELEGIGVDATLELPGTDEVVMGLFTPVLRGVWVAGAGVLGATHLVHTVEV